MKTLKFQRNLLSTLNLLAVVFIFGVVLGEQIVTATEPPPIFITKWGSQGSGDGQFDLAFGVATDAARNVYVADSRNHRIQKFDSSGNFITKWGSYGSGDGQFIGPGAVATDAAGNVYVADAGNGRIQKFGSTGNFVTKWGSPGSGDGQFDEPFGVATDTAGNVYVAEFSNHRVQKFDSTGTFLTKWGSGGSGDGQFSVPYGVATDAAGNVYVADLYSYRIQKFGPDFHRLLLVEARAQTALLLRAQIERDLAEGIARVSIFYLPAALGGQLEFVRDIVTDVVTQNQNAGFNVANASTFLSTGNQAFANGQYKKAWDNYQSAYKAAVR
jgi:DNA-binding beta-propeller fold protein YncE